VNPIKRLGLATLTALTAMAFAGAGTAMAESTALCDEDPGTGQFEVCPVGHLVTQLHEVNLSGSKEKMLFGIITVECDVLFQGTATEELRTPQRFSGAYTYSNCNNGCTVEEVSSPSFIEILKEGYEKDKITILFEVRVNCGAMDCLYGGLLKGKGGGPLFTLEANGEIAVEEERIVRTGGGMLCQASAFLDLRTTPLTKRYVTK
jgi:hypothetical protein